VQALDKTASGSPLEESVVKHPGGAFLKELPLRQNDVFLVLLSRM
jgi:hypothetical protein